MKKLCFSLAICLFSVQAMAGEIKISLDDVVVKEDASLYRCGDQDIAATYYSADTGRIALVKLEFADKVVVASQVLSGSGAKYAGDVFVWWTKGGEAADLYNIQENPEQDKPIICKQQ